MYHVTAIPDGKESTNRSNLLECTRNVPHSSILERFAPICSRAFSSDIQTAKLTHFRTGGRINNRTKSSVSQKCVTVFSF